MKVEMASLRDSYHTKVAQVEVLHQSLGSTRSDSSYSYQVTLRGSVSEPRRLATGVPQDTQVEACIAGLADISDWMSVHHLKLNPDKTELVFLPGKGCPHRDLAITIDNQEDSPLPH